MFLREIIEQNKRLVRGAEPGSCIYGVLEKIAYHLHLIKPGKARESDWKRAQIAFAYYIHQVIEQGFSEGVNLSSHQIIEYIEKKAYELHEQNLANSSSYNWIMAQDKVAKSTAERFKEEEMKIQEIKQKELDSICFDIEKSVYAYLTGSTISNH